LEKTDWQQLSRTTLVLPSHRAGLVLKNELLRLQKEHHPQAVWAPDVKTLTQLQDALSPLYAEDELLTIVRLYKLYRSTFNLQPSTDPMSLDLFYGWGRQMIADFTNIDASMPAEQVPNFFDNTIAAHELSQLNLDEEVLSRLRALICPIDSSVRLDDRSIKAQYEIIWRQLFRFYTDLKAEMQAEQKGYAGMRQRAVIEHWDDESVQEQIAGRTYIFVGFNYLLPVERELMELLRSAGQALFYWDYVTDFPTNTKAFSFAQINSGILGSALPAREWGTPREVTVMACTSREGQAQYVHRWLQQNYTAKGQKVGVVICDESLLESVIYAIPAITLDGETETVPVNITKGFPLRNTHIYTRVLGWLYDKARGDAEQIVQPEIIDELFKALWPDYSENPDSCSDPSRSDTLNWKDLLIMESEYQVRKVANQLRLLLANGLGDVPFTLKLLRLLMRRTMENVTMPFHGEPVTDIQIMGVLETRMLDFDKLLILNVEEGVLPQSQADCSFIPFYLRKAYHMQTSDERATVYAYNFFRLLSRAGHSTLLFTTADGAENSKGMSRFIMQILVSPAQFSVQKKRLEEPSVLTAVDDTRLGTEGVSLLNTQRQPYTLSPSALNTYITCPRKFCLQYIHHLHEAEKEEIRFSPATLGSFVHDAMQYLYETYLLKDKPLPARVTPEEIERVLKNDLILEEALLKAYEGTIYLPEEHKPEKPVIIEYMRHILERDKADAANGLTIVLLEKDRYFDLQCDDYSVSLGGRIDRLDILGEGDAKVLRVVDYKSGSYNVKTMATDSDSLMSTKEARYIRQTFIYSHAVMVTDRPENAIEPNLFFCSRPLVGQQTTVALNEQPIHDYRAVQDEFCAALKTKVQEIYSATSFPPCEPKDCDPFCPFLDLCRRKTRDF
jgi:RecB family exonuclease